MLEQGKVASEEGVHVHPYNYIPLDYRQGDQIVIKPRLLVTAREQQAIFERRALGGFTRVRDAELERSWITSDVTREQRVAGEIAVGPHDEARMRILCGEERLERIFLFFAKGGQCVWCVVGLALAQRKAVWGGWCPQSRSSRDRGE